MLIRGRWWIATGLVLAFLLSQAAVGLADAMNVVTLGADLNAAQRDEMMRHFGVSPDEVMVLEVTNQEEYEYLEGVATRAEIGTRAISSVFLELQPAGQGVQVETYNITWVTPEMYSAALVTAGVNDVRISAAAPFPVSGTAALTGVVKAFEEATGEELPEENKEAAHEELIILSDLAEEVADNEDGDKTTELVQKAKEEILENRPLDLEEIEEIVRRLAEELDIQLTEEQIEQLTRFLERFNDLEIDVEQLKDQIRSLTEDADLGGIIQRGFEYIGNLLEQLIDLFRN